MSEEQKNVKGRADEVRRMIEERHIEYKDDKINIKDIKKDDRLTQDTLRHERQHHKLTLEEIKEFKEEQYS